MASTARVDERVHATLWETATEEPRSNGQVIEEAVRRHQKEKFWRGMREDSALLKADPEAWRRYQAEVALWDQTAGDGIKREAPHHNNDVVPAEPRTVKRIASGRCSMRSRQILAQFKFFTSSAAIESKARGESRQ